MCFSMQLHKYHFFIIYNVNIATDFFSLTSTYFIYNQIASQKLKLLAKSGGSGVYLETILKNQEQNVAISCKNVIQNHDPPPFCLWCSTKL